MARILIAGCGELGSSLGRRLAAAGHQVWGLRRQIEHLPATILPLAADLTDPASYRHCLPSSLDSVFYTAAADQRTDLCYRRTYVNSLEHLISELDDGGQQLASFFFSSSTAVYGQNEGEWLDEDSATAPRHFTGRRLLEAEQVLAAAPWKTVSLRLGGIYGPGRKQLVDRACQGQPIQRQPAHFSNRIHIEDCARALEHLLALDRPAPIYLGVDHAPVPIAEVIDWLCAELGQPPPPPLPPVAKPNRGKRCSNRRLLATDFEFRFPSYRAGYGAFLHQL